MRDTLAAIAVLVVLVPVSGALAPAYPFGAVAVALSGDVSQDGVAIGVAADKPTQDEANDVALQECNKRRTADKVKVQCKLVGTFNNQCAADALDPEPGTPGFGWAIGADKSSTEGQALANCKATSSSSRQPFCRIGTSLCDGK